MSEADSRAAGGDLAGLGVLVTRPREQASPLCHAIEQAGGRPLRFPVIEIGPAPDPARVRAVITGLQAEDLLIFVSANAVHGLQRLAGSAWPPAGILAAVGRATARALRAAGCGGVIVPERGFTSEALLATPALQRLRPRRVLILRGGRGRDLLARAWRARGVLVEYLDVYSRRLPDTDGARLQSWLARGELDVVLVSSGEGLRNLLQLAGASREALSSLPVVVPGERVADEARRLGCGRVLQAADATDAAMLARLRTLAQA